MTSYDAGAIRHLKQSIADGKHWYIALLEAIALWTLPEETYAGRHYRYLIAGQAFDWLLLAERLTAEIGSLIPEKERVELLFGQPPIELSAGEFKGLIGNEKYQAHLNYFYGITVEQALHLAIEMEIEKEQHGKISNCPGDVFQRIYGSSETVLLGLFRQEVGYPPCENITLTELNEFTYWLFKYRIENSDSTRLASDTRKALNQLEQMSSEF
ncbi:MAG: hypothetical protein AAGB97_00220 [Dehalococcoidia bacterium]|nr:hypothetical protein [Chloroflexota bacterium]MBT9162682.1 hypothetical protein [Chloroflexota bacterium]